MAELRHLNFQLTGLETMLSKLTEVRDDMKFKGGRFALRRAAKFLADRVKENAAAINDPTTPEDIGMNVDVRFSSKTFKATGNLGFRVGIMGGARQYSNSRSNMRKGRAGKTYETGGDKRNPGGDTWYWRFQEFGTENQAARPFMRPAIQKNQQATINVFMAEYDKALDRAIARARKGKR